MAFHRFVLPTSVSTRNRLRRKRSKGLLVHRHVRFPKTHAIAELVSILQANGIAVPPEIARASRLTAYVVETRYPGVGDDVTEAEYREASNLAEQVVRWVRSHLSPPKPPDS